MKALLGQLVTDCAESGSLLDSRIVNARERLVANAERLARKKGLTWDEVLKTLNSGGGRGRTWWSNIRGGDRGKYLTYIDELAATLGVDPVQLFKEVTSAVDSSTGRGDSEEVSRMVVQPKATEHIEYVIGAWNEMKTDEERLAFGRRCMSFVDDIKRRRVKNA